MIAPAAVESMSPTMKAKKGRSKIGAHCTTASAWLDQKQSSAKADDSWKQNFAKALRDAHAQGFTECQDKSVDEGSLWCPYCSRVIPVYNLEAHLESKKHIAHVEAVRYLDDLQARALNNELPDWMDVREGAEYCRLCNAFATDGHLACEKHKKRLEWHTSIDETALSDDASSPSSVDAEASQTSSAGVTSLSATSSGCELPEHWGDSRFFEFKPDDGWWRCRLCQCWADEAHITGQKHLKRSACPEHYVDGFEKLPDVCASTTLAADASAVHPEGAAQKSDLPRGWRASWSEDDHREYFYNEFTGEIRWHRPALTA